MLGFTKTRRLEDVILKQSRPQMQDPWRTRAACYTVSTMARAFKDCKLSFLSHRVCYDEVLDLRLLLHRSEPRLIQQLLLKKPDLLSVLHERMSHHLLRMQFANGSLDTLEKFCSQSACKQPWLPAIPWEFITVEYPRARIKRQLLDAWISLTVQAQGKDRFLLSLQVKGTARLYIAEILVFFTCNHLHDDFQPAVRSQDLALRQVTIPALHSVLSTASMDSGVGFERRPFAIV